MGEHRIFRSDNTSDSTDNRSSGRALDRGDPGARVSRKAQGEVGSLTIRAARFKGHRKEDPESEKARWRPKKKRFTK